MSGVYIHGIEISKTCAYCRFCDGIADTQLGACAFCVVDGKARGADTTPKDCPLVPVPEHGRLIDANELMKMCGMTTDCYDCPNGYRGWCKLSKDAANICEAIEDAPTIIPASGGKENE